MHIQLSYGSFFGTFCAIDPEPHRLNTRETNEIFETKPYDRIGDEITLDEVERIAI